MAVPKVEHKLKLLPDLPGCYEMLNYAGKIIYVGKSKDLKHRVRSYFKSSHTGKVAKMVSEVRDFHTIYVSTDKEAFLLEITLIQKYRPYFNIQLKQGHMGYPYIKITNNRNPHLTMANHIKHDGGYYFGPYPDVRAAEQTLDFLQHVYPLKRCHNKHKTPCLYFHMGQCLGGCFRTVPKAVYAEQIKRIKTFLNGNCELAKQILKHDMKHSAQNLKFEKAENDKKLLYYIEKTVEGQKIISHDYTPRDIFNYYAQDGWLCIQVFYIRQARLMKRVRRYIPIMDSPIDDVVLFIINFYHTQHNLIPKEILVPKQLPKEILNKALHTPIKTPLRGQKHSLLIMAYKNSKISLKTKFRLMTFNHIKYTKAIINLSHKLQIPNAKYIDAFDLAYLQNRDIVGACVVFKYGKPDKKLYRRYKIHTGHDDEHAGMVEMLTRRYSRIKKEHHKLPNLILMDGGIIQLNSAKEVLHKLHLNIPVAGMVKDSRHRTRNLLYAYPHYAPQLVPMRKTSSVFFLLTRVQDEIHRFVITYYRHLHNRHSLKSGLRLIPGVGQKTQIKLLRHFHTMSNISKASLKEITSLHISLKTAKAIKYSLTTPDIRKKPL